MKKLFLGLIMVLLSVSLAWGTTIKEDMFFEGRVTIDDPGGDNPNSGVSVSGVSCAGNAEVEGSITVSGPVMFETYKVTTTSGGDENADDFTWAYANGNVLIISGASKIGVALPTITLAMDGYQLWVKNESGATTRTLTPTAGTDYIESTQGTITATSCALIDAAGDMRMWMAAYSTEVSGASSYWMLMVDER